MLIFRIAWPRRLHTRYVLMRVLSSTSTTLTVKLTALPGDPPLRQRRWRVPKDDVTVLERTQLATRITSLVCSSCRGTMSAYDGRIGTRAGVFFACSDCEECFEI